MTQRKKLIEVALPLEAINVASAREKSIRHGHPSTLHLWWARRPLAACRAVIFTSLVDDPDDPNAPPEFVKACWQLRKGANCLGVDVDGKPNDTARHRLFDFIETLVQWESTTDEDVLETARELIRLSTDGNPPPLLDPFAGGGSIPLEAQRLGLEAHASDLNPVAVMINKALIEIPPRFANMPPVNPRDREKFGGGEGWKGAQGLAADVRYYGEWMRDRAWERIGHLYPKGPNGETVIAWLWARTVKCPNPACGAQMPLLSSLWLSKKKGNMAWIVPQPDKLAKTVSFKIETGSGQAPVPPKVGHGAKFLCLVCGEIAPEQYIRDEASSGRMEAQLVTIVTKSSGGRNFYPPEAAHVQISEQALPEWLPDFLLSKHPQYMAAPRYGMITIASLFTPRQLVALNTFSELIADTRQKIWEEALQAGLSDDGIPLREGGDGASAYAEAICVYLAFAISKFADNASSLCSWHSGAGHLKIRATFGRQALPMVWDYAEGNAFSDSSGNFYRQIELIGAVLETSVAANRNGESIQLDAVDRPPLENVCISTDPPYYDNVPYADLSDYFYVWLRYSIQNLYPDIFSTMLVPKENELVADQQRFGVRIQRLMDKKIV